MNVKTQLNLWLIRIYAVVISIIILFDILEGAALKITVTIAAIGIITQSYFIVRKQQDAQTVKQPLN